MMGIIPISSLVSRGANHGLAQKGSLMRPRARRSARTLPGTVAGSHSATWWQSLVFSQSTGFCETQPNCQSGPFKPMHLRAVTLPFLDDQLDGDAGSGQASEIRSVRPTEDCITEGQAMQACGNRTRPVFVYYAGVWWYFAEEAPLHLGRGFWGQYG
jgi:hypothetical protein